MKKLGVFASLGRRLSAPAVVATVVACTVGGGWARLSAVGADQAGAQTPPQTAPPAPAAPAQASAVSASFKTCADWKLSKATGNAELDAVWKVARLGFAHGIVAGLRADPIGFYVNTMHAEPPKPGSPDPMAPLGDLAEKYASGLDKVMGRPAVLVDGFDDRCSNFRNDAIELTDMTLIVTVELGGNPPAAGEEALLRLRAGGSGAHAAMMAALRGK